MKRICHANNRVGMKGATLSGLNAFDWGSFATSVASTAATAVKDRRERRAITRQELAERLRVAQDNAQYEAQFAAQVRPGVPTYPGAPRYPSATSGIPIIPIAAGIAVLGGLFFFLRSKK